MGQFKHKMDEVAHQMGITDPNDPKVLAEVARQLDLKERRLVVIASHPNGSPPWLDKMGTEVEILAFLIDLEKKGQLEYVQNIFVMAEGAEDEVGEWLDFENGQPVGVKHPVHSHYDEYLKAGVMPGKEAE